MKGFGNLISHALDPVWKAQPWYSLFNVGGLATQASAHPINITRSVWNISGRNSVVMQTLSSNHGRTNLTTHSLGDGITGEVNGAFSGPVSEIANFLVYQSMHIDQPYSRSTKQSHIIIRLLKGIFKVRPPTPHYSSVLGQSITLSLKMLFLKTVLLLDQLTCHSWILKE